MQSELRQAMAALPNEQKAESRALLKAYEIEFERWTFQLLAGFSLLFYGLGSKRVLLESFAQTIPHVTRGKCIEVFGYLPRFNSREVFHFIAYKAWQQNKRRVGTARKPAANQSAEASLKFLADLAPPCVPVTVIVHSLDGNGLKAPEIQTWFADLAACKCVHLVASVDHCNAPMMWDCHMADTHFNWWYHHTPTFHHYRVEGEFQSTLLLSSQVTDNNLSGAERVLSNLTPNARQCFVVVAKFQVQNGEEAGIPFHRWFSLCREKFLVTNEMTLRTHLTEFIDHQLLKSRRGIDGQDCLYIPLPENDLQRVLEGIEGQ